MVSKRSCPKGTIERKGYSSKRNGKTVRVKTSCIRATSASGKKRAPIDRAKIVKRDKIQKQMSKKYGKAKCSTGMVERAGFIRQSTNRRGYTRSDGTVVRPTYVRGSETAPTCVPDRGLSGKGKFKIPTVLEKGELKKYGYSNVRNLANRDRRSILQQIVKDTENPLSLFRKLNILSIYNRNQDPSMAELYKNDADWVRDKFGPTRSVKSSRQKTSKSKTSKSKTSKSKTSKSKTSSRKSKSGSKTSRPKTRSKTSITKKSKTLKTKK